MESSPISTSWWWWWWWFKKWDQLYSISDGKVVPVYSSKSCVGFHLGKVPGNYISTLGQGKPVGPTFIVSFFRQIQRKDGIILMSSWRGRAHSFIREEHGLLHQPPNAGSCSCNGYVNVRDSLSRLDWGAFLSFVFSVSHLQRSRIAERMLNRRSRLILSDAELHADAENHSHGGFLAAFGIFA